MKYLIQIVLILINITSCKAQNITEMEQKIIIPEIANNFEKFNLKGFDSKNENTFLKENDYLVKRMLQSYGFAEHLIYPNSFFSVTKLYFKNGNIKEKGISFNNGSEYGTWYEFNEKGELMKTINTDEGYGFDWKSIIRYCEKNKIPLTKGYKEFSGFQTKIYKKELDGEKVWQITYQIAGNKLLKLTLDGKTGKEIQQKEIEFVNH